MNFYECVLLLKPTLSEEESSSVVGKFEKIVVERNGTVHAIQHLGKKKLAYELKKERKAEYVILYIELPNASDELELERSARLDERVLKSMILKRKKLVIPPTEGTSQQATGADSSSEGLAEIEGAAI